MAPSFPVWWWCSRTTLLLVVFVTTCGANTVLITGGAGFLGRHFTHRFCQAGWQVTVVDCLQEEDALLPEHWPPHLQCPPESLSFIHEDYRKYFQRMDATLLDSNEEVIKKQEWTIFLHLATAGGGVGATSESFFRAAQENLAVDNAAFEWVVANPTRRIITKMITVHSKVPELFTSSPPGMGASHVLSKQSGRFLAPALHRTHGLNVALFEAQYVYGEDQPRTAALWSVVRQALSKVDPLVLHRDMNINFLYVEDVVQCVFMNMNSVFDGSVVSLSAGETTNMTAVAQVVAQQMSDPEYQPSITVNENDVTSVDVLAALPTDETLACENMGSMEAVIARMISLQQAEDARERETQKQEESQALPLYSSFQCSGGNQLFTDMKPFNEDSLSKKNKVCKLENVCLLDTNLLYFQHPEESLAPDFVQVQDLNMVKLGITHDIAADLNFQLSVLPNTPLPNHFEFTDAKTWFLILASYSDGIGHLLMDDLYPVLAAMDMFDVSYEDVALTYTGCELLDYYGEVCSYDPTKYRGEVCHDNYEYFSKLMFDKYAVPMGNVNHNEQRLKCFKSLVVGQNYVFNVDTVDKQRAVTLRKGRDLIMQNVYNSNRIGNELDSIKDQFFVLILPKNNPGFQEDVLWPNMCEDVHSMLRSLGVSVKGVADGAGAGVGVVCNPSGSLRREVEMGLINQAAFIIAEHGTLSLLAGFYGGDGTVLVTVGTNDAIKSAETLPYALHLHVLFTTMERMDSMQSLLRYGLHLAATNRNITLEFST